MNPIRNARGLTLVEFTIVATLGAVVVLTISGFYLSAQSMWLDSSVQAVSQRDASLFLGEIGRRIEAADRVEPGVTPHEIELYLNDVQTGLITWTPGNKHAQITDFEGGSGTPTDWPANGAMAALEFRIEQSNPRVVYVDSLRIVSPSGEPIYLSSAFGVYNRP